jgi:hypothetical protein
VRQRPEDSGRRLGDSPTLRGLIQSPQSPVLDAILLETWLSRLDTDGAVIVKGLVSYKAALSPLEFREVSAAPPNILPWS